MSDVVAFVGVVGVIVILPGPDMALVLQNAFWNTPNSPLAEPFGADSTTHGGRLLSGRSRIRCGWQPLRLEGTS